MYSFMWGCEDGILQSLSWVVFVVNKCSHNADGYYARCEV